MAQGTGLLLLLWSPLRPGTPRISHLASHAPPTHHYTNTPTPDTQVLDALQAGAITHAILPMENSLIGTFSQTCRLLSTLPASLHIVGEVQVHETHCLMALPGVGVGDVELVQSHPAILEQCEAFLGKLGKASATSKDTAGMAKEIAERQLGNV